MSKNALQKGKREIILGLEETLIKVADGEMIIGNGKEIVYHDRFEYKHTFADGIYVREMSIPKGEAVIGAIHKHLHVWILLSGCIRVATEDSVEEYKAPCTVLSRPGIKRVIYAVEDSTFTNIHKNPSDTQDLDILQEEIVALNYKEYEEYINKNK
jgi:quercetin dioxygenase-like cupin family protein